jgi:hypothetical protein
MAAASSLVIVKISFKVTIQWIKIDGLGLPVELIIITLFATAFGLPNIAPVGCLVAGSLKTGSVHKGFCQMNRVIIGLLPIIA